MHNLVCHIYITLSETYTRLLHIYTTLSVPDSNGSQREEGLSQYRLHASGI